MKEPTYIATDVPVALARKFRALAKKHKRSIRKELELAVELHVERSGKE